ncbi:MAG: DUF3043 domain-containing protein [Actinobacteria bacterium]|nr:DUF3043 domain-containing protein [Actinomycetota bacterium]MCB9412230.1 DUF3043 domain-containing protein [Actinomycetota bacterium]
MFRRSQPSDQSPDLDAAAEVPDEPQGKGHPTPKRKDAEAARKQSLKIPADPKAAKRAMRERDRIARAEQREAMMRGEESALPARDRGPVRRFVRDWVDSRRLVSEYFLPLVLVILVLTLVPQPQIRFFASISWYAIMVLMILTLVFIAMRLKSALVAKWPEKADRKGAVFYGVMRALQIRRLRVPLPRVKAGGEPVAAKGK